ncbi:hypothetical protein ABZ804_22435 [Streptomyces sp. NPDC047726]|uniref:hypothetical protein n=1 Tax=unclassified Streptomyces TaxID=2593676 RepID=UPI0033FA2EE3
MLRTTRSHTISRHLVEGELTDLGLDKEKQQSGPDASTADGFSVHQHYDEDGALVVVAGAFGPDWVQTLTKIVDRLEQPFVKCTVIKEVPGLGAHQVLVRWATSWELQVRRQANARQQVARGRAADERQELEAAGQTGLF